MSGRSDCIYTKKSAIGRSDFIYTKKSARPRSNEPAKMSWGTMQEKITANTRQKCVVQGSKKFQKMFGTMQEKITANARQNGKL